MTILSDGDKSIKVVSNVKRIHKYWGRDVDNNEMEMFGFIYRISDIA